MLFRSAKIAMKSGRNIYIVGETINNITASFTGLVDILRNDAKSQPKALSKPIVYYQNLEAIYKDFSKCNTLNKETVQRGALIISPSVDLGMQRYSLLRSFKDLRVARTGSSIEINCPIINAVTYLIDMIV